MTCFVCPTRLPVSEISPDSHSLLRLDTTVFLSWLVDVAMYGIEGNAMSPSPLAQLARTTRTNFAEDCCTSCLSAQVMASTLT